MSNDPSTGLPILRAVARNRAVVAYEVDPAALAPLLPEGLSPDVRDGRAYVQLVGVQLTNVRVLGMAGPGFRRVPAVEVQAVVRQADADRQGTWTVQAHVPRRLVAWGARRLYGEPVDVAAMQPVRRPLDDAVEMTYRVDWRGREQRLRVTGEAPETEPSPGTLPAFLRERAWRFSTGGTDTLLRARLERSPGPIARAASAHVTMRWRDVYGEIGDLLHDRTPEAAWLAASNPLTLYWRERG